MKKNLKVVLFSCLVGTMLAGVFFFNIKEKAEAKNKSTVFVYQVGVFKNENNAYALKKEYAYAKIVKDKEYYRVFIGVTMKNQEMLKNWFQEKQYNYYVKEIELSEEILNQIQKYDELLSKTNNENRDTVLKTMLESLPNEL